MSKVALILSAVYVSSQIGYRQKKDTNRQKKDTEATNPSILSTIALQFSSHLNQNNKSAIRTYSLTITIAFSGVLVNYFSIYRNPSLLQLTQAIGIAISLYLLQKQDFTLKHELFAYTGLLITDLNIALQDKDEAKRKYLESLAAFWDAYYTIRVLTLYDFERNEKIAY